MHSASRHQEDLAHSRRVPSDAVNRGDDDDDDDDDDPSSPSNTSSGAAGDEEEASEAPSRANFHARNTKRHARDARAARSHPARARAKEEEDADISFFAFARV